MGKKKGLDNVLTACVELTGFYYPMALQHLLKYRP
jgi:hypothetical protein